MRRLRRSSRKTRESVKRLRVESSESFVRLALPTYNLSTPSFPKHFPPLNSQTLPSTPKPQSPKPKSEPPKPPPLSHLTRRFPHKTSGARLHARRPLCRFFKTIGARLLKNRRPPTSPSIPDLLRFVHLSAISGLIFEFLALFSSFSYQICQF